MGFRIKTVAMLTGVSENTLRAWERRYQFVVPKRNDNGYREYDDDDLALLQAVKRFVDDGYNVREAIELVKEARNQPQAQVEGRPIRLGIVHPQMGAQIDEVDGMDPPLQVVWQGRSLDDLPDTPPTGGLDVAVVDLLALGKQPAVALQRLRQGVAASQLLVLYEFATHDDITAVVSAGARLQHGPVRVDALHQAVVELVALDAAQRKQARQDEEEAEAQAEARPSADVDGLLQPEGEIPERLLGDDQLARLREARTAIECECPNHLAALVTSLVAFERYSQECESRNPDDARVHAALAEGTARARHQLECLIIDLAKVEGIPL